jgi:hypothetical protein
MQEKIMAQDLPYKVESKQDYWEVVLEHGAYSDLEN